MELDKDEGIINQESHTLKVEAGQDIESISENAKSSNGGLAGRKQACPTK